jgi:hypothetical protein
MVFVDVQFIVMEKIHLVEELQLLHFKQEKSSLQEVH